MSNGQTAHFCTMWPCPLCTPQRNSMTEQWITRPYAFQTTPKNTLSGLLDLAIEALRAGNRDEAERLLIEAKGLL